MRCFGLEGYSTPCDVGRGRGVLGSPMFLQFRTPVNGHGIVMVGNEGASGIPLISRAVSPPLSHPVGYPDEPQHTSSAVPSTGGCNPAYYSEGCTEHYNPTQPIC